MGYRLEDGRPDITGRPSKEVRVYDLLDSLGVRYRRIDHEALETMEMCKEVDAVLDCAICKNLFLCNSQKTRFYLLMMPGEKKFKTKELSAQINSARLSFAGAEDMEKYLDITPGSVSVMGLMNDRENAVQLLIDEELLKETDFGCHPCINTASLRFAVRDLLEKVLPAVEHEPVIVALTGE